MNKINKTESRFNLNLYYEFSTENTSWEHLSFACILYEFVRFIIPTKLYAVLVTNVLTAHKYRNINTSCHASVSHSPTLVQLVICKFILSVWYIFISNLCSYTSSLMKQILAYQ
jgi:hypothetical protein